MGNNQNQLPAKKKILRDPLYVDSVNITIRLLPFET